MEKEKAEFDQNMSLMSDMYTATWARMYRNLMSEDFTEIQAIELVKTYILSQGIK